MAVVPKSPFADQYGLEFAYTWSRSYVDWPDRMSQPLTKRTAADLVANLERCFSLALSLPTVVQWATNKHLCETEAIFTVTGKVALDIPSCPQEVYDAIQVERDRIEERFNEKWAAERDEIEPASRLSSIHLIAELVGAEERREELRFFHDMVSACQSSVIITLWTAVEVFTADLLLTVLNEGPKTFAENVVGGDKKLMEDSDLSKEQQSQISFKLLKKYGYDLRHRLGDLLAEAKRVDFKSLKNTAKAYEVAFGDRARPIFDANYEAYSNTIVLAAVRNAIVHNAGRADLDYMRKKGLAGKPSVTSLTRVQIGDVIPIHGESIKQMQVSAVEFCDNLITFVDAELAKASK